MEEREETRIGNRVTLGSFDVSATVLDPSIERRSSKSGLLTVNHETVSYTISSSSFLTW